VLSDIIIDVPITKFVLVSVIPSTSKGPKKAASFPIWIAAI
jgi:hypothetical protein